MDTSRNICIIDNSSYHDDTSMILCCAAPISACSITLLFSFYNAINIYNHNISKTDFLFLTMATIFWCERPISLGKHLIIISKMYFYIGLLLFSTLKGFTCSSLPAHVGRWMKCPQLLPFPFLLNVLSGGLPLWSWCHVVELGQEEYTTWMWACVPLE